MEFLHFYDNANLQRSDLLYLNSSATSYNNSSEEIDVTNDYSSFTFLFTFETSGSSPKSELINNYGNGSGFIFGITDTNRFYLKTPEKSFNFSYPLFKKNTVALTKAGNVFSIHLFDHFSRESEKEIYRIKNGSNNNFPIILGNSFVGTIDQFFFSKKSLYDDVLDQLLSGFQDITVTTGDFKPLYSGIDVKYSNSSYLYETAPNEINRKIYEHISKTLETGYAGNYYASGIFTGSSNTSSTIEGDIYYKTGIYDNYIQGLNINNSEVLSESFISDYEYKVVYHNDGEENILITYQGTFTNSSLDDPFIIYTTINEVWGREITYTPNENYLNDFVMEGVSVYNSDYNGEATWNVNSYDLNKKVKNKIAKYSAANGLYKTQDEFSSVYAYINRQKTLKSIDSTKTINSTSYNEIVRYDDASSLDSSTLIDSGNGSSYALASIRPRTSEVNGTISGGNTYLVENIDYVETSSKDLMHGKEFISVKNLNKTISIS